MKFRYAVNVLPVVVVSLSVASIVLILRNGSVNGFQQWVYFASFSCVFFVIVLYAMFASVRRSQRKQERSSYLVAFRFGGLPWLIWILYLMIRALRDFPHDVTMSQLIAFISMGTAGSLLATWWRLASMALGAFRRRAR